MSSNQWDLVLVFLLQPMAKEETGIRPVRRDGSKHELFPIKLEGDYQPRGMAAGGSRSPDGFGDYDAWEPCRQRRSALNPLITAKACR